MGQKPIHNANVDLLLEVHGAILLGIEAMCAKTGITAEEAAEAFGKNPGGMLKLHGPMGSEASFHQLVTDELDLVKHVVRRFHESKWEFAKDMHQAGTIGLMWAIGRFDPEMGIPFPAYADIWIRNAIFECLPDRDRAVQRSAHEESVVRKINMASSQFEKCHGRLPSNEELAEIVEGRAKGLSPKTLAAYAMTAREHPRSMDATGNSEMNLHDFLRSPEPDQCQLAIASERATLVRRCVDSLKPRDSEAIKLLFGFDDDEMSGSDVGQRLGLTRQRIQQIKDGALRRMRKRLEPLNDSP